MSFMPPVYAQPIAFTFGSFDAIRLFVPMQPPPPVQKICVETAKMPEPTGSCKKLIRISTSSRSKRGKRSLQIASGVKLLDKGGICLCGKNYPVTMFRWLRDINDRRHLVYVPQCIKLTSGQTAWHLVFVDATETCARFVGTLDGTLDGRPILELVDTLHDKHLDKKAWWIIKRRRLPPFLEAPSDDESVYFPRPLPDGANRHSFVVFKQDQWVSVLSLSGRADGDELGYIFRVLYPESERPLYVVALGVDRGFARQVVTVYHEFLREPRIDRRTAPSLQDCWWTREDGASHHDLAYFPAPSGGFQVRDIVSVFGDGETTGVCARIRTTWLVQGERYYAVDHAVGSSFPFDGRQTVFAARQIRGPHASWDLASFSWEEPSDSSPPVCRAQKRPRIEPAMPDLDLGPPALSLPQDPVVEDALDQDIFFDAARSTSPTESYVETDIDSFFASFDTDTPL